jgi:hypothetical protein
VERLYRDLLNREPYPGEREFAEGLLDNGFGRAQAALLIARSLDYRIYTIQNVYRALLGRPASLARLLRMVDYVAGGGTLRRLKAVLFGSPDYFLNRGGCTYAGFVTALYHDVLGRAASPAELATHGRRLARGSSRTKLALGVLLGDEANRVLVQGWHCKFLHREAGPDALQAHADRLGQGVPDEEVLADILGSDEYLAQPGRAVS